MQVGLLTVQLLKFGLLQVATFADQYICRPGHLPVGTNFNETIFFTIYSSRHLPVRTNFIYEAREESEKITAPMRGRMPILHQNYCRSRKVFLFNSHYFS